ncbi:MAG: VCBS repeat-containing protein [Deltaproteobacteria bacterium]|nr:VCBS repeat-containing protein [Deltaproteobacteria bacterium]
MQNGRATLLDINGDALPDFLSTPATGGHQFLMTTLNAQGIPQFASAAVTSAANVGTGFVLDAPSVQTLDVNGDGFTDIISALTGEVRCNNGSGDWDGMDCLMDDTLPAMEEADPGEADPKGIRFFDYDNDKRIDVLRTNIGSAEVSRNTPSGFTTVVVEDLGGRFDEGTLTLTDMNGDGLQDAGCTTDTGTFMTSSVKSDLLG